jgi:hypothetical protein
MAHKGGCHCKRIVFEVGGTPTNVVACNCSICQRKGSLLWFLPRVQSPEESAGAYLFNKRIIEHRRCPLVADVHTPRVPTRRAMQWRQATAVVRRTSMWRRRL